MPNAKTAAKLPLTTDDALRVRPLSSEILLARRAAAASVPEGNTARPEGVLDVEEEDPYSNVACTD
jgi:hypothetical protein